MNRKPPQSDVDFIKALAELLRENELTEIEVVRETGEDESLTVRVARQIAASTTVSVPAPPAAPTLPVAPASHPSVTPAPSAHADVSGDPSQDPGVVPSPMVGTAYLQGEPSAPPFIKVGDTVSEGQTLLIIEAMKTMNQIPAPRSGRVKRILIEDGSPVEFGAPLVILE